jgi:serine/threonine protein kinase/formylglycine-generating enzyme required for sulfatase activity/dienelactone hydrolase
MAAFVEGVASAEQLAGWRRHLRICDRCAMAVGRLRAGLAPDGASEGPAAAAAPPSVDRVDTPIVGLEPNLQIGDFRLERRLGSGGMSVVYQAVQLSLNRRVALKVLPLNLTGGASAVERFHREARAAAKLHHRNIVTIHAEGAESSICYFAMEMIDGQSLDQIIADLHGTRSPQTAEPAVSDADVPEAPTDAETDGRSDAPCVLRNCRSEGEYFNTVARLISEVADALHYAHAEGIIHRDVKPSNLMLARDGRLILLDFGIARICTERGVTLTGSFLGTPRYMSPEQIAGGHEKVDHRSDVYSLGVTLYELLTLEPLFDGDTQQQVIGQVLNKDPRPPRHVNHRIPADLETICCKAIEKEANRRYQSAGEFAEDLRRYLNGRVINAKPAGTTDRLVKFVRRRTVTVVLAAGVVVATAFAAAITWRHFTVQWAQQHAMAEIDRLVEAKEYFRAFALAERAERFIADDPLLVSRWLHLSREYTIITNPLGARVYLGEYSDKSPRWVYLGRTPIERARVPFGTYRWRVEKSGCTPLEVVRSNDLPSNWVDPASLPPGRMAFTLPRKGSLPADMVWIPASELKQCEVFHGERSIPAAPAFLIDKKEVTNRQYKEFMDRGGYEKQEFWTEPFVKDGQALAWAQAMELFSDQTARRGPSGWKNGAYPPGQGDYPAGGLSWYEAAAYAHFRGKDLPTIFHWLLAAGVDDSPCAITRYSNFAGVPAPVGHYAGMGKFGLCDTAGNVREWCYNAIEGTSEVRSILGGSCADNEYAFIAGEVRSPWDRNAANGVRCAMYLGGRQAVPDLAFQPVQRRHRDWEHFTPVSDEVFDSYINMWYKYDRTELNSRIESVDNDHNFCKRERITFDAAYPNERVIAYLFLPTRGKPPYQAVVWHPGSEAQDNPWDERAQKREMTAILDSGRAVMVPFYKGTYERRLEKPYYPPDSILSRNLYVQASQDMRRAIDYLATRGDIDTNNLAFVGIDWGGQMGPLMIAVENRFKTGILLLGGICACARDPASDPADFAPRVKIPMLMINGREDSVFPYETAQRPLFDLLGTPGPLKKHVLFPGGHGIAWECRREYYDEIVKWLDRHLGPTDRTEKGP